MYEEKIAPTILKQFHTLTHRHFVLNLSLLILLLIETIAFFSLAPFFFKTGFFSLVLALWLITFFGYFILKNYLLAERLGKFRALAEKFKRGVLTMQPEIQPILQKKRAAKELIAFADSLSLNSDVIESKLDKIKLFLFPLICGQPKGSFRKALYDFAKEELAGVIRLDPLSEEAHLELARIKESLGVLSKEMGDQKAFLKGVKEASEEFKVLLELSPHKSELYLDLARCYQLLGDSVSEKTILEAGRQAHPHHAEILLRLGKIYFQENEAAKGFKVYEALKAFDPSKSDQLIAFYQ